eukprot:CAMPEP_0198250966 /NCGR_PEP_ID=MMETSP1447-20131203/1963_1 /TAXON_ID=420782 /ORGANISM="Chaetoceros dichaeta, Strain CCMP1751" /LENGTH=542 /DNA_ID=CAMNT_0043935891 /DNA_START=193 /DNA_END=1821 /DNA_ORIENTATION=-
MSHRLTTTTSATANVSSSSKVSSTSTSLSCSSGGNEYKDLFQFSDPSNPPTISGSANDRDSLLERRPFLIVEGEVVRDDILRSLQQQQSLSSSSSSLEQSSSSNSDTFTSKQFLTSFPSGAYTTSRTVEARRVLRLDQHLSRMAESARLMIGAELQNKDTTHDDDDDEDEASKTIESPSSWQRNFLTNGMMLTASNAANGSTDESIKDLVKKSLASAIASFEHLHPASTDMEKRITTLLFWEQWDNRHTTTGETNDDGIPTTTNGDLRLRVLSYVELLPPPPAGRIIAQLTQTQRANALAKDSQWVMDRKALEQQKLPTNPPVHEVLLTSSSQIVSSDGDEGGGDGRSKLTVLEGLSSNFFAITRDGVVYTAAASEGVLLGTLRSIVIQVCEDNGIEVVEEAPPLPSFVDGDDGGDDRNGWVGAFVSSTTRLALPVTDLIVPSSTTTTNADADADAGGDTVDIVNFSYSGMDMDGGQRDDTSGGGDTQHVGRHLGLSLVEETGSSNSYKVGKCISVNDSKGIMKTIVEGVHEAVLGESERPW